MISDSVLDISLERQAIRQGRPFPLGQSLYVSENKEKLVNFTLYSKFARELTLLIYRKSNVNTPLYKVENLDWETNKTERLWHVAIPLDLFPNHDTDEYLYGYRVSGPNALDAGGEYDVHAFDDSKIAVDPYAKAVYFPDTYDKMAAIYDGDNEGKACLGVITEWEEYQHTAPACNTHLSPVNMVIYEMHVKGFTKHESSKVDASKSGTYLGLIDKIPYLQDLGITAVEFLPVQQFDPTTGNYWGYEPLFFFAPHSAYAATKKLSEVAKEFKTMVDAFHKAGIQVFLDVVYNHTGEGDERGPKQSLKLIDNSTYYLLSKGCHANYSGTGNTLHTKNPVTTALTVGSLRYWVTKMGIDGFRFDLASVLSLNSDHTVSPAPPVFAQIASDPTLAGIHFIAEPWSGDGNQDLYQLGSKFAGFVWRQWNAEYRETIQKFINKQEGIRKMNDKIYGSEGLFNDTLEIAKKPFMSVNYIVSHDGFTLYDLVSYEHKKNEDGTTDHCWNWGHDGDIDVPPDVMQLRKRQMKNFIAILMISNGTPMLKAGDEFGQTQGGYNNPYNQDNEYSWLNWDRLKDFADVHAFTRGMIAFRKSCSIFSSLPFWRESASYYGLVAKELEWGDGFKSYALYLNGAKWKSHSVYVLINAYWEKLEYTILEDGPWLLIADTFETSISSLETAKVLTSNKYVARERSVVVLARRYVQA